MLTVINSFNLNFNCHYHLFSFNCHLACQLPNTFHFLNQQLTPSTSPLQLGLHFFNFLGFQLLLGLNTFTLLRLPITPILTL